jgi:hypothetical protein
MRDVSRLDICVSAAIAGVVLAVIVLLAGDAALAGEPAPGNAPACTCPDGAGQSTRPKFAEFTLDTLDESDEIAALETIQLALSRMDDGSPFVWRRANGHLSGIVRPTVSFRNASGALCRHMVVLLTTGYKTRTAEGIACRLANRRWVLEG